MPTARQHKPVLPPDFKPLPEVFEKAGRHFKLIKREGNVALYAISFSGANRTSAPKDWSKASLFEVVVIRQVLKGREIKGYFMPPHEELPSAEQWGNQGFSPPNMERALEIFEQLKTRAAHRTALTKKGVKAA